MKAKIWIICWLITVVSALSILGLLVYKIDPFFHYHKPDLDSYYYSLDNQRSQNDGISKHFDFDTLVTGTSMTENFRTSEVDKIFNCNSIKVPFSGGYYKEINDNVDKAIKANNNLRMIIRGIDLAHIFVDWDMRRTDLGNFPTYLYDSNPFNDVEYLLNRDIIFGRAYKMACDNDNEGFCPGITSFDDYSRWQEGNTFGINTVKPEGLICNNPVEYQHLSDDEKIRIKKSIEYNILRTADANPNIDFYYFYAPYSIAWWLDKKNDGSIYKQLEAEAYATELIVQHKNIHLFSFNNRTDITTDLNNYKDKKHYASWINSLILKWMHEGQYQLTEDNYKDYLKQEYDFYTKFDYESVNGQIDYEADYYAAALLNKELTGVDPIDVLADDRIDIDYNHTEQTGDKEYAGIKFNVNLDDGYNYICFNGQKIENDGNLVVYVYNDEDNEVAQIEKEYTDLDNGLHQYVIDLSTVSGMVTVFMDGGCSSEFGLPCSDYQFSNIYMY